MSVSDNIFLCPKCRKNLAVFKCTGCGYEVPQINSIYQFCEDPPVKLSGENQYISYDGIGEDFEPQVIFWDANNIERYGVYEACGDQIARKFGRNITVLDLGAGLGTASIPLAKNGIHTIAADISNVMLSTGVKRAKGRYSNLIFARKNAYEIMLADSSVDIIIENAVLHLVSNPESVIKEMVRVLKPGGCLIRYSTYGQPVSEEEAKQNQYCNSVLEDISSKYFDYLKEHGYKSIWFDNHFEDIIKNYFKPPCRDIVENFSEVFTEKMKFRLHRLKTGAHSDLQDTPRGLINAAWQYTDSYAVKKYGPGYMEIKGFSRYGAAIDIYELNGSKAQ